MAKRKPHGSHTLMAGISAAPHPASEPVHKGLARGAFAKAAEKFRSGEMGHEDFKKHIHQAHSRLQDSPMIGMASMPMEPMKVATQKHKHSKATKKHVAG